MLSILILTAFGTFTAPAARWHLQPDREPSYRGYLKRVAADSSLEGDGFDYWSRDVPQRVRRHSFLDAGGLRRRVDGAIELAGR